MKGYITLLALSAIIIASCKKNSNGTHPPVIAFMTLEPNAVRAGAYEDTIYLSFRVADQDADLGSNTKDSIRDIYLLDSRRADTFNLNITDTLKFDFPTIPEKAQNPVKGTEGICTIKIPGSYLLTRDTINGRTMDTLHYEVYVTDKAMHLSNHITTPDIYIQQ